MAPPASPFNDQQKKWIIYKFGELKSEILVLRAFRKEFYPNNPRKVPKQTAFHRLIQGFNHRGTIAEIKRGKKPIPLDEIQKVELYFQTNCRAHIREAVRDLNISFGKIWYILRKCLKWKAYTPHKTNIISQQQRDVRLSAADWFLTHDVTFFEKQVLWSDEKYYVLKQGPNRSIDRYWSPVNKHVYDECKSQGQAKAMCWVGLLDGRAIGPFWVDGTMDRFVYADLLEEKVWPAVSRIATRNSVYFMQDGARCHTTPENISYLNDKFKGRVISNKTDVVWPPNSPDLNPLDFFFWGYSMTHVYRIKPSSIEELKLIVDDFAANINPEMVRKACGSARARFCKLRSVGGSHFEHLN